MSENLAQPVILIVEDDVINRQVVMTHLQRGGFDRCVPAGTGQEALDILAAQPIDLVVMDIGLPDPDGFQVTQTIRADYPDRYLPIILISASGHAKDRTRGIKVGANDFLSKPLDGHELVARVTAQVSYKRALDDLRAERERLAALYSLSQALTLHVEYQSAIREIVSLAPQLIPATKAILVLLDEKGEFQQKIVSHPGGETTTVQTIEPTILDRGLIGWVFRTGSPALVADVSSDERWAALPDDEPVGSGIAAALTWGERTLGVLMLESVEKDAFRSEHLDLIAALCSQAAIALENARLYEQMRREQKHTEALLNQIGTPVVVTDPEGRIIRTNPAVEAIFGLGIDVLNKPLSEVFGLALADLLLRSQERGSMVSGEYSRRSPQPGAGHSYNVSISPIAEVGYLLVWQDITGLKESERVRLESERAETQRVLSAFSRYMSTALIERVLTDRDILTRRERREAVVLFADLRGFTQLTVEHPPDAVFALLNDLFSEMLEIVNLHEGLVFDITGDELMIAFNVPYTQENVNQRALLTAIDMQRRFVELQRKWHDQGMEVGMGVGIDRGFVVLGHIGGSSHMNYSMVGEAVNIGHRLVEIAEDAQIVVTPEILADGVPDQHVQVVEMQPRLLKGKGELQPMSLITLSSNGGSSRKKVSKKK
jgi:PAS domain S-box-containing protein